MTDIATNSVDDEVFLLGTYMDGYDAVVGVYSSEEAAQQYLSAVPEYDRNTYHLTSFRVQKESTWHTSYKAEILPDFETDLRVGVLSKDYVVLSEESEVKVFVSSGEADRSYITGMLLNPNHHVELEVHGTNKEKVEAKAVWLAHKVNVLRDSRTNASHKRELLESVIAEVTY